MSEQNNNADSGDKENVCRDFLRNVCKRGNRCKYRHPEPSEAEELGRQQKLTFCHDYQNRECRRPDCRFIHCSREEEDYYKKTGELPPSLQEALSSRGLVTPESAFMRGEIPICKDNLKGECRRGYRCKFRHVSVVDYDVENHSIGGRRIYAERFDSLECFDDLLYGREFKRRRSDLDLYGFDPRPHRPPDYILLEEENAMLRRRAEELKKQISDLVATNEVLLEQNARLRLSKSASAVPVSQTLSQHTITPNVGTIATISQQLPLSGDLTAAAAAAQQSLQSQRIAQELAPQQSIAHQAAIVPVSLAQAIAPVSLAQAIPAVSLAQNLAMSGPSTLAGPTPTLVSYPIVSQGMRAAMSQSSLAH